MHAQGHVKVMSMSKIQVLQIDRVGYDAVGTCFKDGANQSKTDGALASFVGLDPHFTRPHRSCGSKGQ